MVANFTLLTYIYIYIYIYMQTFLICFSLLVYIYIYRVECSLRVRKTGDQSLVMLFQRLKKWYLIPPCWTLSILWYGSRVKWINPEKGVAHPLHLGVLAIEKGAFGSTSTTIAYFSYLYIYIYIYCHPQTDCFVVSQLFSVARRIGRLKLGSKPTQLYVRISIRPLGQ